MRLNPESIARASSRRPWVTVGLWILALVVSGYLASTYLADALTTDFDFTDTPEAKQAQILIEERLRGEEQFVELIIFTSETATIADASYQGVIGAVTAAIAGQGTEAVALVQDPFPTSAEGKTVVLPVVLADSDLDNATDDAVAISEAIDELAIPAEIEVLQFGFPSANHEFERLAEEGLQKGESFGVVIALIVLLVVIGTLVAAVVPIILAIGAIALAFGATAVFGLVFEFSFFVTNMITMIGLAVGIDYALFIVARYREERVRGHDKLEAIGRAGATAGRAVFFSGMTVVLALLGLFFMPNTIFRSLATGAVLVVLAAMAASMTLLPAVIALLGDKLDKLRVRRQGSLENVDKVGSIWDRITGVVMARPLVWLVAGVTFMGILAASMFSLDTGFSGVSTLPDHVETKQAFDVLAREGVGFPQPVQVVIDGQITADVEGAIERMQRDIAADARFGPFDPAAIEVNAAGDLALVEIPLSGDVQSQRSTNAVGDLRDRIVPRAFGDVDVIVLVGGVTAFNLDFFADVSTFTPWVFLFVLGLSFMLLTVVFRSLVVPIKAILLNLLSVGAAYGMVVLFFQAGTGPGFVKDIAEWLGFIQVLEIEAWLPLFLFAILFGLSMDYHVFLLTRIREHFDRTGDNAEAVAHGLRTTGSIITGAALIMVAVFGGFAAGELVPLQQMGFGLAVAVFLDATVIRSILVPATMRLLGDRNWYLPSWLEWLPHIDVEGHEAAAISDSSEH